MSNQEYRQWKNAKLSELEGDEEDSLMQYDMWGIHKDSLYYLYNSPLV